MSKDITVLAPNGRRQIIHCTPDTSILQILEDVCEKHGYQPADYELKHHNHTLDLTTTIRFSNLPNKATVEMVEADKRREETNVTVGLLLEDGDRRTAVFAPNTSLFDLIISLAPAEFNSLTNPTILYMRQEVTGVTALRDKTLRQLGLIKGGAILRLLNKAEEAKQANVSAVYRVPLSETPVGRNEVQKDTSGSHAGPSGIGLNPIALIKHEKHNAKLEINDNSEQSQEEQTSSCPSTVTSFKEPEPKRQTYKYNATKKTPSDTSLSKENLERRLHIEEEVTFLGAQKAIAYMQPDGMQDEFEDLPDEFYELTIEEVRKLYHDLQQHRESLENTPLLTSTKKEEIEKQTSEQKLSLYKNVVVRIQFPDGIILQGVFLPTNTIQDIINFVKEHLKTPNKKFQIFTTPLKGNLNPETTLLEAKFVPCVHMHFKWLEVGTENSYLKDEIYTKQTTSDAASLLASKYRAPSRRKLDQNPDSSQKAASTSKNSKAPKWFKS